MMLTGKEIERQVRLKNILIEPFDPKRLNPNSYNIRLGEDLAVYAAALSEYSSVGGVLQTGYQWGQRKCERAFILDPAEDDCLDMARENAIYLIKIPPTGIVLYPGVLFLASTVERAGSDWFVPSVEGRSSVGRLGIQVHATAGFGDLGFKSHWTLEITVVHPVRIYAGVEIAQVIFTVPYQEGSVPSKMDGSGEYAHQLAGLYTNPYILYQGKYTGQTGPKPSGLWKEFQEGKYGSRESSVARPTPSPDQG